MEDLTALRQVPLFAHMSDEDLRDVLRLMTPVNFAPGAVIIREGEPGDDFYVVLEGRAKIAVRAADGNELVVGEARDGGFFGELSMLTGEPRSARVQAVEMVKTLTLRREAFLQFLERHPQATITVLMELGHRLHRTDSLLRQSVSRNVNEMDDARQTASLRLVNKVVGVAGSMPFLAAHTFLFCFWLLSNQSWFPGQPFDPLPHEILGLIVGLEATLLSIFVLISQNQEVAKDRIAAEIDHQINTKAEIEIGLLLQRVDDLETIVRHHAEEQKQMLARLEKKE
jgi:CRP-like cAMP-binding protein